MLSRVLLHAVGNEFVAPTAPDVAVKYMPEEIETFGEGLWHVVKNGIRMVAPDFSAMATVCCALIGIALLISVLNNLSSATQQVSALVAVIGISGLLLNTTGTLINLGAETVWNISEYGKLLVPVLCTALAAQGGGGSAVLLYTGTILFNTIISTIISKLLIPGTYIYLALCVANRAVDNAMLDNIAKYIKNSITWVLKVALYIFTGYMAVTGVVSGSVDAASIKAAKLAISGSVPVVGGILSDASETLLAGIGIAKNAAGVTGLLVILSIWIGPFLKLGAQYILLKLSACFCGAFGSKPISGLVDDFSCAMGLLVAATGAIGFIHVVSTVCFIRGVA